MPFYTLNTKKARMSHQAVTYPNFKLLIPAAGIGARFGSTKAKQYSMILGKTILEHSLDKFLALEECTEIYLILAPSDANGVQNKYLKHSKINIVSGGKERKDSIYNGLSAINNPKPEDIILIHDAARPCVRVDDVYNLLAIMNTEKAATLASPISSTLRRSDANNHCEEPVSRDNLWSLQTPQAFHYKDIIFAHKNAKADKNYTDDSQLVSENGIPVKLVKASPENIKITYPEDLELARKYLMSEMETRCGQGYDVHAFDLESNGPIRLCGIDIEHTHKLKGHSDADVGLHTLTDAIYGALCAGDIGIHFPPSDNSFKNMDSAIFLQAAMELLRSKGAKLINADVTLICEAPKIGPHAQKMRARIAEICEVPISRINVKATTSEKLGFTGRKEGIAAQAVVSISVPEGALEEHAEDTEINSGQASKALEQKKQQKIEKDSLKEQEAEKLKSLNLFSPAVILATWFYSGLIKPASGTWGSVAALPFGWAIAHYLGLIPLIIAILLITLIGLWAAHSFEKQTQIHDCKHVVIDEVAGQWLALIPALYFFSLSPISIVAAFIFFRIFDILKPWPVSYFDEEFDNAIGVMGDDIIAGLFAALILTGAFYAGFG